MTSSVRTRTARFMTHDIMRLTTLVAATAALLLIANDAWAQANGYGSTVVQMQKNVAKNISYVPKLIGMLGYVAAAFFATSGLLKMKDWINDSERNTMISALMRLVVATLLLFTPYVLKITTGTLGGQQMVQMGVQEQVIAPKMSVFGKS